MGRDRTGVDCVGLLISVWNELGYTPKPEIPPYRRQPDGTLLEYFRQYMIRTPLTKLKPGTVLVFAYGGSPYHAGIVLNPEDRSMIHAYAVSKRVIVDLIDANTWGRKLVCAWEYPGVKDG